MCQDVSQQIQIPLQMTCGARPTDKKTRAMEDRIGNSAPSPPTKQLLRKAFLAGEMVLAKQYVAPTQCEESQGSPCSLHCGTAWEVFATQQLETINGFWCFCLVLDCFFLYKLSILLHIICDASCSCATIVRAYAADKESKGRCTGRWSLPPPAAPRLFYFIQTFQRVVGPPVCFWKLAKNHIVQGSGRLARAFDRPAGGKATTVPKKILARCGMLQAVGQGYLIFRKRHRFQKQNQNTTKHMP